MRSVLFLALAAIAAVGCGGIADEIESTVATVQPIRGQTELEGDAAPRVARATAEDTVKTAERSLARVSLDSGPQLLLGGATEIQIVDGGNIAIRAGQVFVETQPGEQLEARSEHGTIRASDASFSARIERGALKVYVIRGELAYTHERERGVASAGEELTLGARVTRTATALWHDWTGGLARPGPSDATGPEGVGMLEARVPDEVGLARWPLVVRRLDVRVRIERDLAITEVDQLFFNPASEAVEGLYRIRVPEDAVLQRFAVDRDNQLVDGYVREREQARQAYQVQVYRGSTEDPALLEWDAPGSYRARIYPIYPGETRRIVIRYAEWLTPPAPGAPRMYRYPMGSGVRAPHIQELSISADVEQAEAERVRAGMGATVEEGAVRIRRSDFRPRADFWLELVGGEAETQRAWTAPHEPPPRAPDAPDFPNEADESDYFYLPLVLPTSLARGEAPPGRDLIVIADVSAATDRSHLELGRSVVESLTAHLGPEDRVAIVSSDLAIRTVVPGEEIALSAATPERIERLLDGLARVTAGGATDLGAAIGQAAALLDPARASAIIYVGDGAPTVGELRAQGLLDRMARLPHPFRLYAVAVGTEANLELLETLTRGGGLAMRVEERSQAADAALRVLSHLERPIAHGVQVELGGGIENGYPRGAIVQSARRNQSRARGVDAVLGEVFPIVGRVSDGVPEQVTVRGTIAGRAFEHTVDLEIVSTENSTDLRLRWAEERLRQLLLEGAQREEIADLGTRYGLITPFTSYYVPSRRELAQMGPSASLWIDRPLLEVGGEDRSAAVDTAIAIALGPLSIAGCSLSDEAAPPEEEFESLDEGQNGEGAPQVQARAQTGQPAPEAAEADDQEGGQGARAAEATTATPMPSPVAPVAEAPAQPGYFGNDEPALADPAERSITGANEPVAAQRAPMRPDSNFGSGNDRNAQGTIGTGGDTGGSFGPGAGGLERRRAGADARVSSGSAQVVGSMSREIVQRVILRHLNEIRFCYEQGLQQTPTLAGDVTVNFIIAPTGPVQSAAIGSSTLGNPRVELCIAQAFRRMQFPASDNGGVTGVTYPLHFTSGASGSIWRDDDVRLVSQTFYVVDPADHQARRCSDAADLPLDDRRALWRERLGAVAGSDAFVRVYEEAVAQCEARTWRDKRALLSIVLAHAGSIDAMVQVYRLLQEPGARSFVRAQIFARVRTPDDLRQVRDAFGLGSEVDWALVSQILARTTNEAERIRALRRLSLQYPDSSDLKLRLLSALEGARRMPEAKRLADRLRADPLSDPGTRTAIGEMFLRIGEESEARRAFSEIVEFAPLDELARRRLGDLYRAHGWYQDAYRQYQTLAEIRPDDPSVQLLLAQAAAGAGRVNEALQLEHGLMQNAQDGASEGIARTALLWSSVRFARMRKAARERSDERRLRDITRRMRRSGVLREAGALRVTLVWSHPDAQLGLYAGFPGLPPSRPTDITPEFGLEALHLEEQEPGSYTIEVRHTPDSNGALTRVRAELVVVWNEGQDDEQIEIVPLTFDRARTSYEWTLNGRALTALPPGGTR